MAGAVLAGMVIGIWHTTLHVEHTACTTQTEICLGPPLGGLIAGIAAVVITTLAGFALLGIRPLVASVPAGIIIAWLAVTCVTTAVHDVGSPSAWALIPVLAAGYALVASVVLCPGRTRVIALCLLAAFMLTGQPAAKMIGNAIQTIVTARYRDMIVTASAATADAPADAIEQAATTLHPATASQIQALG